MSVYNATRYLAESISSILDQTFTDFEFIIINDGSTDKSREAVMSFSDRRIVFIDHPDNRGLTIRLNEGLARAKGEFIARQDADDISTPERLAIQTKYLSAHDDIVMVGSSSEKINEIGKSSGVWLAPESDLANKYHLCFGCPMAHGSILFRKKEVMDSGGYDKNFPYAQDFDLYSRLGQRFKLGNIKQALIKLRLHRKAVSSNAASSAVQEKLAKTVRIRNLKSYIDWPEKELAFFASADRQEKNHFLKF